jgi:hypothetical protein
MASVGVDSNVPGNKASPNSALLMRIQKDKKYTRKERELDPGWATDYWQTGLPRATIKSEWRRYLTEHHCHFKVSDNEEELKARAQRCARGHPSYDGHNVKKLKSLAQGRGLDKQLVRKLTKGQLVQQLEAADDEDHAMAFSRGFSKFFALPPELRNRVYVFHFRSLCKVPPRFITPALCRASRQLRLESTGLFFEHCTFIVSLRDTPDANWTKTRLQYHTRIAKAVIPTPMFARIKHLHIELRNPPYDVPWSSWTVDLTNKPCVQRWLQHSCRGFHGASVKHHVRDLIETIMTREGNAKLKKSDLRALEVAVAKEYYGSN